jgi:hypothetical protein
MVRDSVSKTQPHLMGVKSSFWDYDEIGFSNLAFYPCRLPWSSATTKYHVILVK